MTDYIRRMGFVIALCIAAIFFAVIPCLAQDAQQYYQQGLEAYGVGEYDRAIANWKSAASLDQKSAKIQKALGLAYYQKSLSKKDQQIKREGCQAALAEFQKAVSLDPNYAQVYSDMAGPYECLGDNDKAIQSYEKAIALNPKLKDSYYYLALLYKQRNEIARAKQLVKQGDLLPAEPLEDTDQAGWYGTFLEYLKWKSLGPTLEELRQ